MDKKHKWTYEEEYHTCEEYIKTFVIAKEVVNIDYFIDSIFYALNGEIKRGSILMRLQNIKAIMNEKNISDSFPRTPLKKYSIRNLEIINTLLKEFKII